MNNNVVTTISSVGELSIVCAESADLDSLVAKNYDRWRKKAFKNAWKRTMEKLIEECSILSLEHEDFEISSWNVIENFPKINKETLSIEISIILDVSFKKKE